MVKYYQPSKQLLQVGSQAEEKYVQNHGFGFGNSKKYSAAAPRAAPYVTAPYGTAPTLLRPRDAARPGPHAAPPHGAPLRARSHR